MVKAYHELDRFYWNPDELRSYEQAEKYEHAYHASMRQKYDEGEQRGMEKGIERGEKMGEYKAKITMAKSMLSLGIPRGQVLKITGLNEGEV
jgi:predicted transposase/invertase (TIGR01784 family)